MDPCSTMTRPICLRQQELESSCHNIVLHLVSSYKTDRQICCNSLQHNKFQKDRRAPLTVELALTSYQANRSWSEVDLLGEFQLSGTYKLSLLLPEWLKQHWMKPRPITVYIDKKHNNGHGIIMNKIDKSAVYV